LTSFLSGLLGFVIELVVFAPWRKILGRVRAPDLLLAALVAVILLVLFYPIWESL